MYDIRRIRAKRLIPRRTRRSLCRRRRCRYIAVSIAIAYVAMRTGAFPNNLVPKISGAENPIETAFADSDSPSDRNADKGCRLFEDAMKFDETRRHHREIGHHW